jgi:lipoate-protein ligase B
VITLGRSGSKENILFSKGFLNKKKVTVQEIERGGDAIMHCPGQLVGYPIMDLKNFGRDLHLYLRNLEEVLIKTLGDYGIKGIRKDGYTGVWIEDTKIGFIGVAVQHWITYHGFAFNVAPDLEYFSLINPCGMKNGKVTSLSKLLKREVKIEEVIDCLIPNFNKVFRR